MDEGDKKQVEGICWKTIFIAVVLVSIGVVIGRFTAGMCPRSQMGRCGSGYSMKSYCGKGDVGSSCRIGSKCCGGKKVYEKRLFGCKEYVSTCKPGCTCPKCCQKAGMCRPGCTCPKCSQIAACTSDPNKASCPMMEKKAAEPEKE